MRDTIWTWANILSFAVITAAGLLVLYVLWRERRQRRPAPAPETNQHPATPPPGADQETLKRFKAALEESGRRGE